MSDGDLIKIIAEGGPALGKSPQTPAYRGTLAMAEIKAVVAYLRAVADPPYPGAHGQIGVVFHAQFHPALYCQPFLSDFRRCRTARELPPLVRQLLPPLGAGLTGEQSLIRGHSEAANAGN
jgi:hypothetical protein